MTPERHRELECGPDPQVLTAEEIREGWHFCPDWDYMLIHKSHSEFECCTCKDPITEILEAE